MRMLIHELPHVMFVETKIKMHGWCESAEVLMKSKVL